MVPSGPGTVPGFSGKHGIFRDNLGREDSCETHWKKNIYLRFRRDRVTSCFSFPSWTSPVRPRSPALVRSPCAARASSFSDASIDVQPDVMDPGNFPGTFACRPAVADRRLAPNALSDKRPFAFRARTPTSSLTAFSPRTVRFPDDEGESAGSLSGVSFVMHGTTNRLYGFGGRQELRNNCRAVGARAEVIAMHDRRRGRWCRARCRRAEGGVVARHRARKEYDIPVQRRGP